MVITLRLPPQAFESSPLGSATAVLVILIPERVFLVVILMVLFSLVERSSNNMDQLSHDGLGKVFRLFD